MRGHMSNPDIFVSLAYTLYVLAPALRDELWLRTALFFNSVGFAAWGLMIGSWPVVVANVLFALISLRQMRRAFDDRRQIVLPEDAALYGAALFPTMLDQDLDRFWKLGQSAGIDNDTLTNLGEPATYLYAVLEGHVTVLLADGTALEQSGPSIIGEISSLAAASGAATATVIAQDARVHKWLKSDLDELQHSHPSFTGPFLRGLSAQMAGRVVV